MMRSKHERFRRRAAVSVYVALGMTFILGFMALAVDMGMLYSTKAEMQRAADAAAMAGAWRLLDEDRLKGGSYEDYINEMARYDTGSLAASNVVLGDAPIVDLHQDVQLGVWRSQNDWLALGGEGPYNAVSVWVKRDSSHGGSIAMTIGKALGLASKDMSAYAVAGFQDQIGGFRVTEESGNAEMLPFALHIEAWEGLLDGTVTTGDYYSYDDETGTVSAGGDGILELNLYPGAGAKQLPPGNFGTVDIGSANNSTADLSRQILYGINASDLSYFGGEIMVPIYLNGDTGISAGVKDELAAIKGQPRSIPIFDSVSGNGNNAMYHVIGWGCIRIMNVKLTGPMAKKEVVVQIGTCVDDAAVSGDSDTSDYVYRPVQLVR